jgi:multiple sugar transport system substrate-binding protein
MKRIISLLLVLCMMLSLPAVLAETATDDIDRNLVGDGKTVVKIAFDGEAFDRDMLLEVCTDFFNETGISVQIMFVPTGGGWGAFFSKIQTMIVGGDTPDLIRVAVEGFELFRSNGLIVPYNEYIEKYPEWAAMVNNDPALDALYTVDGEQYGYSFDWNSIQIYFNKNVLAECGLEMPTEEEWSLDTFLEYAKAMTYTREDGSKVYGAYVPNWFFVAEPFLYANGGSILSEDFSEATCNSPEVVEIIQLFHDMVNVYECASFDGSFMGNELGMTISGRWYLKGCHDAEFYDCDIMPAPPKTPGEFVTVIGGGCFPISSASEHKDEAFKLACWLSSDESQKKLMTITAMPSSVTVMEEVVGNSTFPENAQYFIDAASYGKLVEAPADYAGVEEIFLRYLGLVYADEMGAQEAMDAAKEEIDLLLAGF